MAHTEQREATAKIEVRGAPAGAGRERAGGSELGRMEDA